MRFKEIKQRLDRYESAAFQYACAVAASPSKTTVERRSLVVELNKVDQELRDNAAQDIRWLVKELEQYREVISSVLDLVDKDNQQ